MTPESIDIDHQCRVLALALGALGEFTKSPVQWHYKPHIISTQKIHVEPRAPAPCFWIAELQVAILQGLFLCFLVSTLRSSESYLQTPTLQNSDILETFSRSSFFAGSWIMACLVSVFGWFCLVPWATILVFSYGILSLVNLVLCCWCCLWWTRIGTETIPLWRCMAIWLNWIFHIFHTSP